MSETMKDLLAFYEIYMGKIPKEKQALYTEIFILMIKYIAICNTDDLKKLETYVKKNTVAKVLAYLQACLGCRYE